MESDDEMEDDPIVEPEVLQLYPCLLVDLIVFSSLCFDYTKYVWVGVVSGGPH